MNERRIYRGSHGEYHWLTSTEDYSGTLLRLCPEIVIDRYVAVTSVDSGVLRLRDEDLARGWRTHGGIGYSPLIRDSEEVPHQYDGPDALGYDEFYVFGSPCGLGERMHGNLFEEQFAPAPGRVVVFVSLAAFVLHDPKPAVESLLELFWPQLERLRPESYVADGTQCLTFVSRRKELVKRLHERLEAQL
ncbi:MAG TPA: hypothetical protein VGK64_13600 [Bryobacteraceae bacterium]